MKKILALLLVCVMLTGLCACAPTTPEGTEASEPQQTPVLVPEEGLEVRSILMIGNSACYYFCDELFEMAKAAGIDLVVANLYISGCRLNAHVENLQNETAYTSFTVRDSSGEKVYANDTTMRAAVTMRQWDAISLQQAYPSVMLTDAKTARLASNHYAKKLFDFYKEAQPEATLFWHQTWIRQTNPTGQSDDAVTTPEQQAQMAQIVRDNAHEIAYENGAYLIPVGDAWQLARANAAIGDTLCNKNASGETDYIHDGEVGGGQYLNACVWYEILLQKSCIGNTFRPSYGLTEEKIAALQRIAHEAVAALYGENYAK